MLQLMPFTFKFPNWIEFLFIFPFIDLFFLFFSIHAVLNEPVLADKVRELGLEIEKSNE